ncbi:MAG: hypothetical protein COB09_18770 [Thalassobium sp.]|nr:MAG: hypothetical protein COB09_18770 [Thalassobium sp.]
MDSIGRKKEFEEWLEGKPQVILDLAEKLEPWNRYRVKKTGQHCHLISYFEDGTVTINIYGHDDEIRDAMYKTMPIHVFGIKPEDLEIIE